MRLRRKLRPSSTCSTGAYGPGIRMHGRPARATPGKVAPRFGQRPTGADRRHALVDEDDRGRSPDGDLLPERPDAGGQVGVRRLVARGRDLEQVGDAVAGGQQGVVGGLDRRPGRDDTGGHQAPPEGLAETALVVVAGLDADRRRVEPDEQQPIAQWREVGEGVDRDAVDLDRRTVGPGPGRRVSSVRSSGSIGRTW